MSTNLNQPFSGYSNGWISFNQDTHNNIPALAPQKVDDIMEDLQLQQPQPQHPHYFAQQATQQLQHQVENQHQHQPQQHQQLKPQALQELQNQLAAHNAQPLPGSTVASNLPTTNSGSPQAMPPHFLPFPTAQPATLGLPAGWQSDPFWNQQMGLGMGDGHKVAGSVAEIYMRYPEARGAIWHHYYAQVGDKSQSDYESQPLSTPSVHPPKASKRKSKSKPATATSTSHQVPAYAPDADLDTPQKCRDYLAYVDAEEVHKLQFEDDDWRDVMEKRKQEFIGRIFNALTHPHSRNPPRSIDLNAEGQQKYSKQQNAQTAKVVASLQTAAQLKAAKALCSLLFDAVVYVHEIGVPKEVYEGYHWFASRDRTVDRKYRVDMGSICSARLEKIIAGIKANKLIATDVLEQTNFHRMARDPEFYLVEKFTYLRSNKTRQDNIERHNKQDEDEGFFDEVMGKRRKKTPKNNGKRKRPLEEDSDGDGVTIRGGAGSLRAGFLNL